MKKLVVALLFLSTIQSNAQNVEALKLSIAQAIEIGIQNRYDAKANKFNVDIANNTIEKRKKEWLPDFAVSANIKYNTKLQEIVLPDGFGNGVPTVVTMGAKNQSSASLDLTQNLFKPGLNTEIQIAREEALLEREKATEMQTDIKFKITEAYLNTLLKGQQMKLAISATGRYLQYLRIIEEKCRLGVLTENDLLKARLDYENTKLSSLEAKQNYELTITQLKYQINISNDQKIILTDSIYSLRDKYLHLELKATEDNRTEIKQLRIQAEIYSLQLRKSRQYFIPTTSLYANYTTQFQTENFDYSQSIFWSPYNSVGVKFILPITGNLKNHSGIKENRLKIEQNQFQMLQKQSDIAYEIGKSRTELENTLEVVQSSENNLELSRKVLDTQSATYQLGTISYNSILDTETSLHTAEQNYIKAVYNFLVAKINFEKASGI